MKIDILKIEWDAKAPHWLSPRGRVLAKYDRRREQLRQQWLANQRTVDDFDPDQPRAPQGSPESRGGQWVKSGGGVTAITLVSPYAEEGEMDLSHAQRGMEGLQEQRLMEASHEIDTGLGLKTVDTAVVGVFERGAEPSMMTQHRSKDFDKVVASSVMKASLGRQKSVLAFMKDPKGDQLLYHFKAAGPRVSIAEVHARLVEDGIIDHTIVPDKAGKNPEVYVYDGDGSAADAVAKGAARYGSEIIFTRGQGRLIGSARRDISDQAQREDAHRIYAEEIARSGVQGVQGLWGRINAAYGGEISRSPEVTPEERQSRLLIGNKGDPATISSRIITAQGRGAAEAARFEEARTHYARADLEGMKQDTANFANNVALFSNGENYPQFRPGELDGTPDQQAETVVGRMASNLEALYNDTPEADRALWARWYEGAHNFVTGLMHEFGYDRPSTTAVVAALSPNKEWDPNAYLARQVIKIYHDEQATPWSPAMDRKADELWTNPKKLAILANVRGRTLGSLADPTEKAMWIRTFDEATSDRTYHLVNIDGTMGALATNKDAENTPSQAAWQSLPPIAAAIYALEYHGDVRVLSDELSDNHKVRSFYNNILDPNSPNLDLTADTHAAGGALLGPYGGKSTQINQHFGTSPEIEDREAGWSPAHYTSTVGAKGLYPLYAEAYRRVAAAHGLQPRQLQSILWEHKIEIFGEASPIKKAALLAVWHQYRDGQISLDAAQQGVIDLAKRLTREEEEKRQAELARKRARK